MKKVFVALNGKKIPIALGIFIITTAIGYGELKTTVKSNANLIEEIKPEVQQVAVIQKDIENIKGHMKEVKGDLKDFREDVSREQRTIRDDIKEILKAVK